MGEDASNNVPAELVEQVESTEKPRKKRNRSKGNEHTYSDTYKISVIASEKGLDELLKNLGNTDENLSKFVDNLIKSSDRLKDSSFKDLKEALEPFRELKKLLSDIESSSKKNIALGPRIAKGMSKIPSSKSIRNGENKPLIGEKVDQHLGNKMGNNNITGKKSAEKIVTQLLNNLVSDITSSVGAVSKSTLGKTAGSAIEKTSGAGVNVLANGLIKLAGKSPIAAAVVATLTFAIVGLGMAAVKSQKNILGTEQAIKGLGGTFGSVGYNAIKSQNSLKDFKSTFSNVFNGLGVIAQPFLNVAVDLLDFFSTIIKVASQIGGKSKKKEAKEDIRGMSNISIAIGTMIKREANSVAKEFSGVNKVEAQKTMANTAVSVKQTGISNESSAVMAVASYREAIKLAEKFGTSVNDTANALTDAWVKNSDAAKQFGIIMDDELLAGWLAQEKSIDSVNVKLSDAAMMAYRFEFAMVQAGKKGSSALQLQIKKWKEYGAELKASQGQLLGFEQAVTLQGIEPKIPEISEIKEPTTQKVLKEYPTIADKIKENVQKAGPYTPHTVQTNENKSINIKTVLDRNSYNNSSEKLRSLDRMLKILSVSRTMETKLKSNGVESGIDKILNKWKELPAPFRLVIVAAIPGIRKLVTLIRLLDVLKNTSVGVNIWDSFKGDKEKPILSHGYNTNAREFKERYNSYEDKIPKFANGGISTGNQLINISEGNKPEAVIPLASSAANPAFDKIAIELSNRIIGASSNNEANGEFNVNFNGMFTGDQSQFKQMAKMFYDEWYILQQRQGGANYGIRG